MSFCSNCGKQLKDGANFCANCGKRITPPTAQPVPPVQPAPQPVYTVPPVQPNPAVNQSGGDPYAARFANIIMRYRCPQGHVFDGRATDTVCKTCGAPLQKAGVIHLYRMGNMMGVAVGMGIYIDDVSMGHIANKQSVRISVPYGAHKIHVVHTATRKCNDPVFTVTPENPTVYCKAYFTNAGWAIGVEQTDPNSLPTA